MAKPTPTYQQGDSVRMDSDGSVFVVRSRRWERKLQEWVYTFLGITGDFSEYEFTRSKEAHQ